MDLFVNNPVRTSEHGVTTIRADEILVQRRRTVREWLANRDSSIKTSRLSRKKKIENIRDFNNHH